MNKNAIKKFAIEARKKLIDSVTDKAGMLGITEKSCSEPIIKGADFEVYQTVAGTEVTLNKRQCEQRRRLASQIESRGFEAVVEEVAYTWFNRICAIRFMEVNDYLPNRVRVLSSEKEGKMEPDLVTQAPDVDLDLTTQEKEEIINWKMSGTSENTDKMFGKLFLKQCHQLHDILPGLFEADSDYMELLFGISYTNKDDVIYTLVNPETGIPEAEQEETVNVKLAEIRTTYKELKPTDITCIDPCMGSGHILIAMFDVLMDIYESAGYDKREAAFEIVEHNIHGLDIDQRAYQLAYFAVMMKGRGYNRRFLRGRDGKPEPKVYAIAESNEINRKHLKFFGTHLSDMERNLATMQIEGLLDTFVDAREYGSILNVDACDWDVLEKFVEDMGTTGQISFESVGSEETQESLRKLVRVAKNLGQKYDAVVTNPPYMGASGMGAKLSKYVKDNYLDSKSDLFAVFIEKCGQMTKKNTYQAMITQHAWMFLSSFEKLRNKLQMMDMVNMAHLGPRAFEEIGGEVVQTTSFVIRKSHIEKFKGTYCRLIEPTTQLGKEKMFLDAQNRFYTEQSNFFKIPGKPIAYWISENYLRIFGEHTMSEYGSSCIGMRTGDNERFLRFWYEINKQKMGIGYSDAKIACQSTKKWFPYCKGGSFRKWYGNNEYVVNWENDGSEIKENTRRVYPQLGDNLSWKISNEQFYFKKGLTWSGVGARVFGVRSYPDGMIFDSGANSYFVNDEMDYLYFAGLLNCTIINNVINVINPTINTGCGVIAQLPAIKSAFYKSNIEQYVKSCINISQIDWDSFETSWDFMHHPLLRKVVSVSEAFMQWKTECDSRFNQLKINEEELNRIFINIYGLKDEIAPEVEDKNVTVRKADLSRDIRGFISYAVGCMFGRYSVDEEGLIYAGGEWNNSRYKTFIPDEDNCIPITDEEYFSDDIVGRFVEFVKAVYGADTLEENLDFIANALGNKGDTSREVIRNYFLKDFYADHLKVYQKRPIYWLFDSGKQNGFKALIYMHRYDADTVGRVRTDYLHRAQKYVETAMQSAQYTIDNASSASEKSKATKAVTKYTKQLAEMKIYDEAIAHIANKRIEIDLDDGVKVNYEKFQGVEVAQEGKKTLKVDLLAKIK